MAKQIRHYAPKGKFQPVACGKAVAGMHDTYSTPHLHRVNCPRCLRTIRGDYGAK